MIGRSKLASRLAALALGVIASGIACAKGNDTESPVDAGIDHAVSDVAGDRGGGGQSGNGGQGGAGGQGAQAGQAGQAGQGTSGHAGKAGHAGSAANSGAAGQAGTGIEVDAGVVCGLRVCLDQWCRAGGTTVDISFNGCCVQGDVDVCGATGSNTGYNCMTFDDMESALHLTCKPKS
jgi:hypothetical protein